MENTGHLFRHNFQENFFVTELQRDGAIYYLIFCRSVWHYPLRLDNPLYIEVVFNQIAPDYLEGLLLVMPGEQIDQEVVYDIAKVICSNMANQFLDFSAYISTCQSQGASIPG